MFSLRLVGLNNFSFCILFLTAGGTAKQAFASTLLFQIVLLIPLLFAISANALERIPSARDGPLPCNELERYAGHGLSVALSPTFWLLGAGMTAWAGWVVALCYLALATLV